MEQLQELVARVGELLDEPGDKGVGRPKELSFTEAVAVACAYARHNIVEEVLAELWMSHRPRSPQPSRS